MYEGRRKRGANGADGPRIRLPGSMVSRLGYSGNLEKSRRPADPPPGNIPGARARLSGGASEMYRSRRKRRPIGGEWPQNQAARIDGQSRRICLGAREIPAIAGSAFRENSRRKGEITRGRVRNVHKSAQKRRFRGEWPQNPAAHIEGQSRRMRSAALAVTLIIVIWLRARGLFWPPRGCVSLVLVCAVRVWCWLRPSRGCGGFVSLCGSRLVLVLVVPRLRWFR